MSQLALINTSSGSVPSDAVDQLSDQLRQLSLDYTVQAVDASEISDVLTKNATDADAPVIVWGGDGTLACALESFGPSGPAILGLPGGTMNLLHKAIHGSAIDWRTCLTSNAVRSEPRVIAAGLVNDRKFYVAALLGKLTELAGPREDIRAGEVVSAAATLARSEALNVETALSYQDRGNIEATEATSVGLFLDHAASPVTFDIGAIDPDNLLDLARTSLSAMLDDWRTAIGVDRRRAGSLSVRSLTGDPIEATLDGEMEQLPADIEFSIEANAGRVVSVSSR